MASLEACSNVAPSLSYVKPSLQTILTLSAFLLSLNVLHDVFDRLLYAGILAQVVLGAVFGAPLANILSADVQSAVQSLGYLGLLLLVYEGGRSTRLDILSSPSTFFLALATGLTGIAMPIVLSMVLLPFAFQYTFLQSFVVGAALSSTSLGTTLAVISATASASTDAQPEKGSLPDTRDDNAAEQRQATTAEKQGFLDTRIGTILIGAALLDDIVALVLSSVIESLGGIQAGGGKLKVWPIVRPILTSILLLVGTILVARVVAKLLPRLPRRGFNKRLHPYLPALGVTLWLAIVCAFISIADEIDSTDLIGTFCAGAFMVHVFDALRSSSDPMTSVDAMNPDRAFYAVHQTVQSRLLSPFFFASIGFAIPVREMFTGTTVWKGVLYSGLMGVAKVMACLPVLLVSLYGSRCVDICRRLLRRPDVQTTNVRATRVWPPAVFLGLSLVARGEIGFLIINVARQAGILACTSDSPTALQAFDVGVWAITMNTFIGPTVIGILLRSKGILAEIQKGRWGFVT
jgi:Kef-type K+ transport system membrane component KefB